MTTPRPRLILAGGSGDAGKTLVSLALLLEARERGVPVRAFKKGPDYIDAAWLTFASGAPSRNLDTYLMGFAPAVSAFATHSVEDGLNVVEGNRGLYDGFDEQGSHSTAELAKALDAPVVLVINAAKVTRTASAFVLGCQRMDRRVRIAGIILNRVNGKRHEQILRGTIERICDVPVVGAIPNAPEGLLLPSRHLGLVTPAEHPDLDEFARSLRAWTSGRLDFDRLWAIACEAPPMEETANPAATVRRSTSAIKIGYLNDSAFTFYYPENLDALRTQGAELVPLSALSAAALPRELDALYIGGGFPETHASQLSANTGLLGSLHDRARQGMPVYAECGGLMLLSRAILWEGRRHPMAGILPFEVEVCPKHQGHGYVELQVDSPNPFFPSGMLIKGHEFHYSRAMVGDDTISTACAVLRGTGTFARRDGVIMDNVWAGYTHLHATATPKWASNFVKLARGAAT
jgi:cobyrinic acid a,c-diamide synthase